MRVGCVSLGVLTAWHAIAASLHMAVIMLLVASGCIPPLSAVLVVLERAFAVHSLAVNSLWCSLCV
jgi:hypothetical protein